MVIAAHLRHLLLVLVLGAACSVQAVAAPSGQEILDRTRWVDIGPGRWFSQLKPSEIARMKRCEMPSMMFQKSGTGLMQTWFGGMFFKAIYPRVALREERAGLSIFLYTDLTSTTPAETIQVDQVAGRLTQWSRHFRPRKFVRCDDERKASRGPEKKS